MTKSIFCKNTEKQSHSVKVKIIKAPLVDSGILKQIWRERQRALVL